MTNTQVFHLSTDGKYPNERYLATPKTFTSGTLPLDFTSIFWNQLDGSGVSVSTGGSLVTREYLKYHKNPSLQVLDFSNSNYNKFLYYNNTIYQRYSSKFAVSLTGPLVNDNRYIENVSTITISNAINSFTSLVFDISALRQTYKTPYEFYFFYVTLNDTTKNSYGYLLYPNKIFLKPKKLTNNNGKWQLTTSINVISSSVVHIQSTEIEKDAYYLHKSRLNALPTNITTLPTYLSGNDISFDIYASKTKTYLTTANLMGTGFGLAPSAVSLYLDPSDTSLKVNPDSTFISYSAVYFGDNTIKDIVQIEKGSSFTFNYQAFNPSFIVTHDPTVSNIQTFQLLQAPLDNNLLLSNSLNCVLSSTIDLNTGLFNFNNYYKPAKISFNSIFPHRIDYIADSTNLKNAGSSALSTLTNQSLTLSDGINQTTQAISSQFKVSALDNKDIIWETSYPPYCYSYKLNLKNGSNNTVDSNSLNFYLKLSAVEKTAKSVKLSAFVVSDFNAITMPLMQTDQIKFEIITTTIDNPNDFLDVVTCAYGNDNNLLPYDIKSPVYKYVTDGAYLSINYDNYPFTGITFCVKASIINSSEQLDTFDVFDLSMEVPSFGTGTNLFLDVFDEKSNSITIDSSFNVSTLDWPSRDLKDSKILWTHSRNDLPLTFSYVDEYGSYIGPVNGPVTFSDKTWRVNLSGYGPNLVTVSLSSEKYLEVATLSSNPNLYDILSQGKLKVGIYKPLNNLDLTRTIELTAAIPYGNQLFNIPSQTPINWTWVYDDVEDPQLQPIQLKLPLFNNKDYIYGIDMSSTLLSCVKVNVTPGYSNTSPKYHKVKLIASVNTVSPPITGEYTFKLDDFPDPSIFNCNFSTFYSEFKNPKYTVDNTGLQNYTVITRPNDSVLNFTFSANGDIRKYINNVNLNWAFNSIKNSVISDIYTIDLTNPLSGLPTTISNGLPVTAFKITLSLNGGYANGWTSAHNVSADTYFYILNSTDFYNPLKFIIYPEYAWLGNYNLTNNTVDYTHLTLLSTDPSKNNYFTNCFMPSAYKNKKSNSQTFWVSANKNYFEEYIYLNSENYTINSTACSYDLLDISYNPYDYLIMVGMPISLIAYNNTFYPENIKLSYIDHLRDSRFVPVKYRLASANGGTSYLVTLNHNITAATTKSKPTTSVYNNFFISPILKDYNDISLDYAPLCNDEYQTTFNIQSGGKISVVQLINTSPEKMPAVVTKGSVTYCLSTKFWTVSSVVPFDSTTFGLTAKYDLFEIKQGDPSIPYYACDLGKDEFYFYGIPDFYQQIPKETFDGTGVINNDLWSEIKI